MRLTVAVAIVSLMPLSAALADVYRSVDAQGHVLYSDTPAPGAELIRTGNRVSPPPPMPAKATATTKPEQPVADPATREAAERSVAGDVAQTREQQCTKAKDQYTQAVAARRIYNVGPNGERQFLSDDQAEQQRVNAKLRVDELCNGGPPTQQ